MKIKFTHDSIRLIPSSNEKERILEINFINYMLGLEKRSDKCICVWVSPYGFDTSLAYLEIKKGE